MIVKQKKFVTYEDGLHDRLKDPMYAAEYLNAHLAEDDEDAVEAFLVALRDVAAAHGITSIAKKADLGRESIYKTLSKSGNPKIATLTQLLKSMGLKLSVEKRPSKKKRAS